MVNLQSAENALKSFYLDAVKDSIDMKSSPFMAMIEHSNNNVYGKDVKKLIRTGVYGGVVAGTETGELPKTDSSKYVQLTATLKNLYGTIEISDKAIRAAQSSEGAFINLLNEEMEGLLRSAKFNFNRMIMGDGSGYVLNFRSVANGTKLNANYLGKVEAGMRVIIVDEDGEPLEGGMERMVEFVDRNENTVILSGEAVADDLGPGYLQICNQGDELTGLKALFEKDNVYGLSKEEYQKIKPIDYVWDDQYEENMLLFLIDMIEERSGSTPNLILCSYGVRRAIVEYYKTMGVALPSVELEGGFKALSINGIPIVADRFCDAGTIYLVNTNDFKLYQLCDWQWMESDDGKILHQVPGKPVYNATLVKYAELLCERPTAQARILGVMEK